MRWGLLVAMFGVVFAIVGLYVFSSRIDLSAIQQPGHTGEYLRTKLTRAVIRRRAAREAIPPPQPDRQTSMSIAAGKNLYDMDCASCHGSDETGPTPVGRGMLPRACKLIPIANCFRSFGKGCASPECRDFLERKQMSRSGMSWTTCAHFPNALSRR